MNPLEWVEQKVSTWQGIVTAIVTTAGTVWGAIKFVPTIIRKLNEVCEGAKFTLEVKAHHEAFCAEMREHNEKMRTENRLAFSRLDDQMNVMLQMQQHRLDADQLPWFTADERGLTTWVNRAFRRLTGLDVHEAKGRGWENGIAAEDRERVIAEWDRAILHSRGFDEEVTYVDRSGKRTKMHISATPSRRPDGTIIGWMGHAAFRDSLG